MNIVHVVESLDRGGLERVVVDLALSQQSMGHFVAVVCLFHAGKLRRELKVAGIPVLALHKRDGIDLRVIRSLFLEFGRADADVVHTHNAVANYYAAIAALFRPGIRIVNTRHGMGAGSRTATKEILFRLSLYRTAAVVAVCRAALEHFSSQKIAPRRKMFVVHNGICAQDFDSTGGREKENVRGQLGISSEAFVVGTVGRLNWAKDQSMLIESFVGLAAKNACNRLIIIGEGELRAKLEIQIKELGLENSVVLLGDRNDVSSLLFAFDVFVLTSKTEGYSVALLEASASGVPIIASDVGGNSEIVQHRDTGIIVKNRTADDFAAALEELANDQGSRIQMGNRAREWANCHAGIRQTVSSYENLYARMMAKGGGGKWFR